jgi:hypothetical protein
METFVTCCSTHLTGSRTQETDMKRIGISLLVVAALLVTLLAASAIAQPRNFTAHLTGDEEVPAVDTRAVGQTVFQLNREGTELRFRLIAANIEDVTMAHIHCGAAGENGPVVAWLYPDTPPPAPIPGRFSGVLNVGTVTAADVVAQPASEVCPGGVANFDDLLEKISTGGAYVNVHTLDNPAGEIRGQIR